MKRLLVVISLALMLSWSGFVHVPKTFAATIYSAVLTGSQETPPHASTGTGVATVVLSTDQSMITVNLSFSGIASGTTAAHIHNAPPGTPGPVVIPLTGFPTGVTSGTYSHAFAITPAQVAALKAGNLYINIHSTAFPGGEIRGQLGPAVPTSTGQCKHGGYKNYIDPRTGRTFKNQGQCVSFVNHQHDNGDERDNGDGDGHGNGNND